MQLSVDRLLDRLADGTLDRSYFFYGDEPLQLAECADALRRAANAAGIAERLVFTVENTGDWEAVRGESGAMSLFAERRLIDIRFGSRKPDKHGTAVLTGLLEADDSDDIHVVSCGKLDGRARKSAWFKALDQHAVTVVARDLDQQQLPAWLARRAARFNKRLSTDAAELVADRVEGNLLAAAQEVEKLCLLVEADEIDAADVIASVTDSTRFDVYQFVDAMLARRRARTLRIARGLREEGTEPVLLVWALGRELRNLAAMAAAVAGGQNVASAMDQYRVWGARKTLVRNVLERYSAGQLLGLVAAANHIDTIVKGGRPGAPWDEIELLVLRFCGWPGAARMLAINQPRA